MNRRTAKINQDTVTVTDSTWTPVSLSSPASYRVSLFNNNDEDILYRIADDTPSGAWGVPLKANGGFRNFGARRVPADTIYLYQTSGGDLDVVIEWE